MTTEHIVAFNIALLAAIASPGPALLVALKTTLSGGRRAGLSIGCGLAVMAALWTAMALLGLETIFIAFPWAYTVAKIGGALYLLYIAIQMWRGARNAIDSPVRPATHSFAHGFLVNLLNPKSILFAAAVLVVVFPPGLSAMENAIIVLNHLVIELCFYTVFALLMSKRMISEKYLRSKLYIDRTASVLLGGFGIRLLADL